MQFLYTFSIMQQDLTITLYNNNQGLTDEIVLRLNELLAQFT